MKIISNILFCMLLSLIAINSEANTPRSKSSQYPNCIGFAEAQGRRPSMEDAHCVEFNTNPEYAFFGVFDGHGGRNVADFVAQNLPHKIKSNLLGREHAIQALLQDSFIETHNDLDKEPFDSKQQGCTAITALIKNGKIYVANAGDSRAVLASAGKAFALSEDHKPDRPSEKNRIEQLGGKVIVYGVPRVNGVLAVSRAIGDKALNPYVIPSPEIREKILTNDDEFLILACDGVWDVIDNQTAVDIVKAALKQQSDLNKAADVLKNAALQRGSTDNISVMIIDLKQYLTL